MGKKSLCQFLTGLFKNFLKPTRTNEKKDTTKTWQHNYTLVFSPNATLLLNTTKKDSRHTHRLENWQVQTKNDWHYKPWSDTSESGYSIFLNRNHYYFAKKEVGLGEVTEQEKRRMVRGLNSISPRKMDTSDYPGRGMVKGFGGEKHQRKGSFPL